MRIVFFLLSLSQLSGQNITPPALSTPPSNLPAQQIGANDLLNVTVYGAPELSRTIRVSPEGMIRMPMVRADFPAAGKFPGDLEAVIATALAQEQILIDPVVTVTVAEYVSRPISVMGAVKQPLTFQAFGNLTLIDALSRAGGLTADAGGEILLSRSQPGLDGKATNLILRVPVKQLIDQADPELNYALRGGEEVRVPEASKIFVVGNVKKPGAFAMRDNADNTVLKMLALSEGLMPFATDEAYIYRREGADNGKNEIAIPLAKIIERKSPDVTLMPNDVLYIPDNKRRRMTMSMVDRLVTFGAGTASGMLVWRR
ncbi:polysaccharide biosynthesis/export family protein [Bryobacter aggregatus]|uniref:polysaccharide biosynthesis/export family protein n=1 Tax=Bryobacter aggregatus TaxID=360054 RepID=UPI0004E18197|nr:polysaccharide biosynthesis/export family protein [Bryobacter aggregatus]